MVRKAVQYLLMAAIILLTGSLLATIVGSHGVSVGIDFALIIIVVGVSLITKDFWV